MLMLEVEGTQKRPDATWNMRERDPSYVHVHDTTSGQIYGLVLDVTLASRIRMHGGVRPLPFSGKAIEMWSMHAEDKTNKREHTPKKKPSNMWCEGAFSVGRSRWPLIFENCYTDDIHRRFQHDTPSHTIHSRHQCTESCWIWNRLRIVRANIVCEVVSLIFRPLHIGLDMLG